MRALLLALLLLAAVAVSAAAPAQVPAGAPAQGNRVVLDPPRGPRLEYTRGPAACLSPDELATELRILMRAPLRTDAPDVVKVWCSQGPVGFTCRVQHVDASGTSGDVQRFDGWDCWRVGRETALAVAEIAGFMPEPKECPAPEPCPACPPAAPCRCPPPRVCPSPPKPPKWNPLEQWYHMSDLSLYALGLVTGGLWADPGGAAAVGLEVRGEPPEDVWTPAAAFGLEVRVVFPGRVIANEPIDPGKPVTPDAFEASQYTLSLVPCARWRYVFGCGLLQGGFLFVEIGPESTTQASLAVGPRLGVRLPISDRFAVFGLGEVLFAPVRAGFRTVPPPGTPDPNSAWRIPVAQGYGGVGVEVTFP